MPKRHPGRGGRDWERARAFVLRNATTCSICNQPIDFSAPPRSRWAPSVDHLIPLKHTRDYDMLTQRRLALDTSLLAAVHYSCNSRKQAGRIITLPQRRTSRQW